MSNDKALGTWRSIRTTFVLFLVVVPVMVVVAIVDPDNAGTRWTDLVLPAASLIAFAGLVAEAGRRIVNFMAGADICHWRTPT